MDLQPETNQTLPTPNMENGIPSEPKPSLKFALYNALIATAIIFVSQVATNTLFLFYDNVFVKRGDSLYGEFATTVDPPLATPDFQGISIAIFVFLFITTFLTLKYFRLSRILLIVFTFFFILGLPASFLYFQFGGFAVPALMLEAIIPPLFFLSFIRSVKGYSFHNFKKYYIAVAIITVSIFFLANLAQRIMISRSIDQTKTLLNSNGNPKVTPQ